MSMEPVGKAGAILTKISTEFDFFEGLLNNLA